MEHARDPARLLTKVQKWGDLLGFLKQQGRSDCLCLRSATYVPRPVNVTKKFVKKLDNGCSVPGPLGSGMAGLVSGGQLVQSGPSRRQEIPPMNLPALTITGRWFKKG